ncbi:Putative uncharacterized protein [Taphrina deformans PYCC 5710]|uniref:PXA domain-containing protein n=1 Tax=Taphrina deformans (strain PYCC 5710 / ATCC 11124 / CBS 356.35 / IMI 108563 / JCM 9778 / NBRC 8474) TaxID=1097556 RepID=R4XGF9_TAPDE|nr:Putative uncharacterized protein [Taphrina deformans PYCC 5710]|eukprot:CCG82459.1 Putative uncharacterized protein [Taphrina deformans PYCC 5710]
MERLRSTVSQLVDDLGPLWIAAIAALVLISVILKTWLLVGFVAGALMTLYLHPYESPARNNLVVREWPNATAVNTHEKVEPDVTTQIPQKLKSELDSFSCGIIKDYVRWWYTPPAFPTDDLFPDKCKESLDYCLKSLYRSFSRKDPILYLDAIFTNTVATLGAVLDDLRMANRLRTPEDSLGFAHLATSKPNAISVRMMHAEERKEGLRRCTDFFLNKYVQTQDMNCLPAASFMREVIAELVFGTSLRALAHRDTINGLILANLKVKASSSDTSAAAKDELTAALNAATHELTSTAETQEINVPACPDKQETAIEDESDVPLGYSEPVESTTRPSRGRRLSFKHKSVSSISEVSDDDGNRVVDRRKSFLQKTSSLLSKSRSRSTSPVKAQERQDSPPQSPVREHGRSRSISPFKKSSKQHSVIENAQSTPVKPAGASLFQAELIVNDASDITNSEFNKPVTALPKFSILISPIKQEGYTNTVGIGVFRSILDIEDLDKQLRISCSETNVHLPEWRKSTYAVLENSIFDYLVHITRNKTLAESKLFKQFCRPDVMSEERPDEKPVASWGVLADSGKAVLGSLRKGTELMRPQNGTPKQDPAKRMEEDTLASPTDSFVKQGEMKALFAAKEMELRGVTNQNSADGSPEVYANVASVPDVPSIHPAAFSKAKVSSIDRNKIDVQNLVSQSMELLTTFYALSSRTWTIRKQLLNLLRNLLLSKNSIYSQTFMHWLEAYVLYPLSDADAISVYLHQFNDFMFPVSYIKSEPLSSDQSSALASEARALFIQKGMPQAIRNLMGAPPTSEALGILFDALQDPEFSLGLVTLLFTENFKTLMVD